MRQGFSAQNGASRITRWLLLPQVAIDVVRSSPALEECTRTIRSSGELPAERLVRDPDGGTRETLTPTWKRFPFYPDELRQRDVYVNSRNRRTIQ